MTSQFTAAELETLSKLSAVLKNFQVGEEAGTSLTDSRLKKLGSFNSSIATPFTEVFDPKPEFKDPSSSEYYADYAEKYIDFTYDNPTIYHVVEHVGQLLEAHGFTYLSEKKAWPEIKAGRYYTTRNGTSLSAFAIGDKWVPENGVGLVGAHIDVLTTKLKPCSVKSKVKGFELLGSANYAGALSELWWDRDLFIGGRVLVKDNETGLVKSVLVKSDYPIARIPSLAPHFGKKFSDLLNHETRAVPVIAFDGSDKLPEPEGSEKDAALYGVHSLTLLRFIAKLAKCEVADLVQLDLDLFDGQRGAVGGINKDFLYIPRVDDRICGFTAIYGLLETLESGKFKNDEFSLVTLYDNEEIGSLSRQGARGGLSESVIMRAVDKYPYLPKSESLESTLKVLYANTLILSADVSHAFNPNFSDVYLEHHAPLLNTGVSISFDERAMATDVVGRSVIEEVAKLNGDTVQKFHIRNDSRSGGTIGPHISSLTGARTVDLGIAQWSMHSIRATVGSKDVGLGVKFFGGFFKYWSGVSKKFGDL